jgi:hypothetical protein
MHGDPSEQRAIFRCCDLEFEDELPPLWLDEWPACPLGCGNEPYLVELLDHVPV